MTSKAGNESAVVSLKEVQASVPSKAEPSVVFAGKEMGKAGTQPVIKVETAVLPEGKTLRLLALELFGSKEFWVYIYLENRDRISNPNKVASGMELILPDRLAYSIDAADPQSVDKAKSLGNEVLREF